jgi:hypothetical protein
MYWSVFRVLPGPEEAQKQAERARAPIVPFGVDLCYWGQEQLTAGKILKWVYGIWFLGLRAQPEDAETWALLLLLQEVPMKVIY